MSRTTKLQVQNQFQRVCDVFGQKANQWEHESDGWYLDYSKEYGGYVITSEHGSEHPFGLQRRSASAFWDFCHATSNAVEVYTGKSASDLWKIHAVKSVTTLWTYLTDEEQFSLNWVARRYDSGFNLYEAILLCTSENEPDYENAADHFIRAYYAGSEDGADNGTIPCLGGRLLEKWEATKSVFRLN